ncbi:MAG: response regulator transcription factor [Peptococcaceae bacterium]|nr:response regulator transcription factor [Peptococcaceae bacterium]
MKVVVVDDHLLVWEGIKAVFEPVEDFKLAGWASNGHEAEQLFAAAQPDIALVDLRLPGEYGIEIIKKVRSLAPGCRFVVLTTYGDAEDIKRALDAGVDGYLLKEALPEEMTTALRLVGRGRPYFDPAVMQFVMHQPSDDKDGLSELTEREREVLRALARGLSNKEIAGLLCVTEHTVKKHISSILGKLELKDRTQAALYAVAHGIGRSGTSLATF